MVDNGEDEGGRVAPEYLQAFERIVSRDVTNYRLDLQRVPSTSPAFALVANELYAVIERVTKLLFAGRRLGRFITSTNAELFSAALGSLSPALHSPGQFSSSARDFLAAAMDSLRQIRLSVLAEPEMDADLIVEVVSEIEATVSMLARMLDSVTRAELERLVESVAEASEQVSTARDDAKEAAGEVGQLSLAHHFDVYASREDNRVWVMRTVSALLIGIAVFLGNRLLEGMAGAGFAVSEMARLLIVVPILVLAYYFIREAGHHRDAAQRAKENAVRLKTIAAFATDLNDAEKDRVRAELGKRVFGVEATVAGVSDEVNAKDAASLLGAVTALVGVVKK
jgi:hypothetical protein